MRRKEQTNEFISIHAPPRGATSPAAFDAARTAFQFTPLREGRPEGYFLAFSGGKISIHAPPRGATMAINSKARHDLFQFTPLREGRRDCAPCCAILDDFNSRPSARGDRKPKRGIRWRTMNFNSRPSARGDKRGSKIPSILHFNSRPSARGDDFALNIGEVGGEISIHAPPRGATRRAAARSIFAQISIHAPPRGATMQNERKFEA